MTAIARIVALMATLSMPLSAQAAPWRVDEMMAVTDTASGVLIAVGFMPVTACDHAALFVIGNTRITLIGLSVDGQAFAPDDVTEAFDWGVYVVLTDAALDALRHGRRAWVITDRGRSEVSLRGSATALERAYADCQRFVQSSPARPPLSITPFTAQF